MPDRTAFEQAKQKIIGTDRQRPGIGTLSEKTVHAILKNYYEPDGTRQEILVGKYVADICRDGEIIEIQTRQLDKLRGKLAAFLPLCPVTIVHPIPREKQIVWIDEESGEPSRRRKSPQKGTPYTAFPELYKIKMFLKDPNLRLRLLLLDMEEYRLLSDSGKNRKKGARRYDCIPTALAGEVAIDRPEDYLQLVPPELESPFTSRDFAKAAHISRPLAQMALNILSHMEAVSRIGKTGNSFLYSVSSDPAP